VETGSAQPRAQDESQATFQGLVDDSVARIDLERPAEEVDRLIRGCDPQPGAFVKVRGERLRLYDGRLEPPSGAEPGTVAAVDAESVVLALRGGNIRAVRVRADQGKEPAAAFAERVGLRVGEPIESG
jgi:methionyl-tRNA formyltransferase